MNQKRSDYSGNVESRSRLDAAAEARRNAHWPVEPGGLTTVALRADEIEEVAAWVAEDARAGFALGLAYSLAVGLSEAKASSRSSRASAGRRGAYNRPGHREAS